MATLKFKNLKYDTVVGFKYNNNSRDDNFKVTGDMIPASNGKVVGERIKYIHIPLSNEEYSFCNFCYSMENALRYFEVRIDGHKTTFGEVKNPKMKQTLFSMIMETVEREVLSWVKKDASGKRYLEIPQNRLYEQEFGNHYNQVMDFILYQHGILRKENSTITERENGDSTKGKQYLCKPKVVYSMKKITESLDLYNNIRAKARTNDNVSKTEESLF